MKHLLHVTCVRTVASLFLLAASWTSALDVYGKRFAPPRLYFNHANLNKGGVASGIEGQDNVLTLYMTAIDKNEPLHYTADGFTLSVLLPAWLNILGQTEAGLTVTEEEHDGKPYLRVEKKLDQETVFNRCLRGAWGVDEGVWYRTMPGRGDATNLYPIEVTLRHGSDTCFTDRALLRIYPPLSPPPPVNPKHFRFWLHYGPHVRLGHWDELADCLRNAGINAIQFTVAGPNRLEYVREMRKRGFYTIAQRGASYSTIHKDNFRGALTGGPAWFASADNGTMQTYLPDSDAVLWDFEPTPTRIEIDEWTLTRFRQEANIPADVELTEETIKKNHFPAWIAFRQDVFAACVKHWADFCRSVKPEIETILTEGRANMFDPPGQINYAKVANHVTFCDPMNYTGIGSIHVMRQWQEHAPRASFTGCQNVALSSHHNVFISPKTIMLQILSSALIGTKGTDIYPGPAMDAENFVLTNRVMGFLGHNQGAIFTPAAPTSNIAVFPLPKESFEIELGDGRTIRNTFPDWQRDAIIRMYQDPVTDDVLLVVANWNAAEPCYVKVAVPSTGDWLALDEENGILFTAGGSPRIPAQRLAAGIFLECPPFDYRGFRLRPWSQQAEAATRFAPIPLANIMAKASRYAKQGKTGPSTESTGSLSLGFDDRDRDGTFEYVVRSPEAKVWVSQYGTVTHWEAGGQAISMAGLGLCRDMIWIPQTERANAGMDAGMTLDERNVSASQIALSFSKDVTLETLGGMASVKVTKAFTFPAGGPRFSVDVSVTNTSVTMDMPSLPLCYRVHNHIDYGKAKTALWVSDGQRTVTWDDMEKHYSIPNAGLKASETAVVFGQNDTTPPHRIVAFGDYFPAEQMLLTVRPKVPAQLLQILRWGRKADRGGSGTIEWIYRPYDLQQGGSMDYGYEFSLQSGVASLNSGQAPEREEPLQTPRLPLLLFHATFTGTPDAVTPAGITKATVSGTPTYEPTPDGQGIRLTEGVELSFPPEGLINLPRGKIHVRFKPLWDGTDQETHYLLTVRPIPGFIYFGKIADGRLLMNMFDRDQQQHYPSHVIRTMEADTWHEATVTWDADMGTMILFLDGRKVGEYRRNPWTMGRLTNSVEHCRLVIPGTAEATIDDIKIWDRP